LLQCLPPFWWDGFRHTELQLMVYGRDIGEYDVAIDHPGVSVLRVDRTDNDNYLFVYLDIADAAPGAFDIVFERDDSRLVRSYELLEKNPDPGHTAGFTAADAIYLITPDRFANGDPDNDTVDGYSDALNRADDYGRHGGDVAGIKASLDYIADMGFTAIWLNPILENAMPEASYHGYATTDFYRVDPRFGSNAEYRELVAAARGKGLGMIMDMITNHSGSNHWWMHDLPARDWINFRDDYHQTSSAKTPILDPYASEYDKRIYFDGWYVPAMPDLNQRNPLLADYLIQNALYSFSDTHFLSDWARRIMEEYPEFNITGEETVDNPLLLAYWQRGKKNHDGYVSHTPSMLDFPLFEAVNESLTRQTEWWDSPWRNAYETLGADFQYPDPFNLVVFPDNHDRSRIFTKVGEDYDLFRMAIAYYLTIRGVPQIYYGTEVLLSHPGTTSHGALRMEFPGGWPDHEKNAFTGEGLTDREREAQSFMRTLLNWRKGKAVVHAGKLMQYTPIGNAYVYFRYDDEDTVMVAFNRGFDSETLATERFEERLAGHRSATDVITGQKIEIGEAIELPPRSVQILEIE
jgi:glycosidase